MTATGGRKQEPDEAVDRDLAVWHRAHEDEATFSNPDTADWIVYRPAAADFAGETVFDASGLLDAPSGKHGWLRASADGAWHFEDGTPVRFIGGQLDVFCEKAFAPKYVQWLRRFGLNFGRSHAFGLPDAEQFDRLDHFIHECKQGGVYLVLTPIYKTPVDVIDPEGSPVRIETLRICFFNENVERALREIWEGFWTHENPYTGLRYCDDPTIAMTELKNEDSTFWALDDVARRVQPTFFREIQAQYSQWLGEKYGCDETLRRAWTDEGGPCALEEGESIAEGNIDLLLMEPWWDYTSETQRYPRRRKSDQMEFLHQKLLGFYERSHAFLRRIGLKQAICGSNWRGKAYTWRLVTQADAQLDFIDQHDYWDHPSGGWHPEDTTFHNQPMIRSARGGLVGNLASRRVAGKPYHVSEWNIGTRNECTMEAIFLMAVYGRLQGWDGLHHFVLVPGEHRGEDGKRRSRPNISLLGPGFFNSANDPSVIFQYPTLSRLWHRGDVREAEAVFIKRIDPSLYYIPGPVETQLSPYAFMFIKGALPPLGADQFGPMACAVGKIAQEFVDRPQPHTTHPDLREYLDEDGQVARSLTGELSWDWGAGVCVIDTPRTQGLCGFAGGRRVETRDAAIEMNTGYGVVLVTTLNDEMTVYDSDRLLVTALGRSRNTGQLYGEPLPQHRGTGPVALHEAGREPIVVEPVTGTITLRIANPEGVRAYLLDHAGRREREIEPARTAGALRLPLPGEHKTFFYELVR